jgi:hypothetical protein
MYAMVINPFQQDIIQQIQGILEYNDVDAEDIYFAPLIPFGFLAELMDDAGAAQAKEIIETPNDVPDAVAEPAQPTEEEQPENPNEVIGITSGDVNMSRDWDSYKLDHNYEISR